jgi:hypothetical protein
VSRPSTDPSTHSTPPRIPAPDAPRVPNREHGSPPPKIVIHPKPNQGGPK